MKDQGFTSDRFLGGRLAARQPKDGFRAGHDTVLVAAAVPAVPGDSVLELGAGAGIASLCLAARVEGISILGIEIDEGLAALATANTALNAMADRMRFEVGDAGAWQGERFTHVFFNPPFHPDTGRGSPDTARERAKRAGEGLIARWTAVALAHATATVTAILRADRVEEMVGESRGRFAEILPLRPREGVEPKRAIVRIDLSKEGRPRVLSGIVLHGADGKNTPEAEAILRHAQALAFA